MSYYDELKSKYPAKAPVRKSPKPVTVAKLAKDNQPVKPTADKLVNETAKAGLLANAEACDREAIEWQRKADEKTEAIRRISDRTIINHYTERAREYRAHAELSRSRADSFRRAAASLGQ